MSFRTLSFLFVAVVLVTAPLLITSPVQGEYQMPDIVLTNHNIAHPPTLTAASTGCAQRDQICGGFAGVRCCDAINDKCIYDRGSAGHCRPNKQWRWHRRGWDLFLESNRNHHWPMATRKKIKKHIAQCSQSANTILAVGTLALQLSFFCICNKLIKYPFYRIKRSYWLI